MVGEPGAYMVRERVQLPGVYAIAFLSCTGHIHHFKISSNCGNYYIGGRQFDSLNDLIGFYANCSHIIENESLAVPVVPPKVRERKKREREREGGKCCHGGPCQGLMCCWSV
jgi:Ras GTPase-activating protein 1